jgi:hypothetical protein
MSTLAQYLAGVVLVLVVSLVHSLARRDESRSVLVETVRMFIGLMGTIAAVVLVVLLVCKYK